MNTSVPRMIVVFIVAILALAGIACLLVGSAYAQEQSEQVQQEEEMKPPRFTSFHEVLDYLRESEPLAIGEVVIEVESTLTTPSFASRDDGFTPSGRRIIAEQYRQWVWNYRQDDRYAHLSDDELRAQVVADDSTGKFARLTGGITPSGAGAAGAVQGPYGLKDQLEEVLQGKKMWVVEPNAKGINKPEYFLDAKVSTLSYTVTSGGFHAGPLADIALAGVIIFDGFGAASWGAYYGRNAAYGTYTSNEEITEYLVLNLQFRSQTGWNLYEETVGAVIRMADTSQKNIFGKFSYQEQQRMLAGATALLVSRWFGSPDEDDAERNIQSG